MNRKSSKPFLHWFQRKLGGGNHRGAKRAAIAIDGLPIAPPQPQPEEQPHELDLTEHSISIRRSTFSAGSSWKDSNPVEADEDASIRPIPPTSPPSPVPSRSSSSFVSDPRTFKSVAGGSTRPTTLLSVDLGNNGMAHIAQVPSTPNSIHNYGPSVTPTLARLASTRTVGSLSSGNAALPSSAVTFSQLPPSNPVSYLAATPVRPNGIQAPLHTSHHPRFNPRPSSPPNDNASMITLASSAYGAPGPRYELWSGDSQSHIANDNASHTAVDELQLEESLVDASVRALRPRSSRRGSWDSQMSKWSVNSPAAAEKSIRTTPSVRTNGWLPPEDVTGSLEETDDSSATLSRKSEQEEESEQPGRNSTITSGDANTRTPVHQVRPLASG